jgi:hypothetical protein
VTTVGLCLGPAPRPFALPLPPCRQPGPRQEPSPLPWRRVRSPGLPSLQPGQRRRMPVVHVEQGAAQLGRNALQARPGSLGWWPTFCCGRMAGLVAPNGMCGSSDQCGVSPAETVANVSCQRGQPAQH